MVSTGDGACLQAIAERAMIAHKRCLFILWFIVSTDVSYLWRIFWSKEPRSQGAEEFLVIDGDIKGKELLNLPDSLDIKHVLYRYKNMISVDYFM